MTPRVKFDPALLPERPDLSFEIELWKKGATLVAGIDEAGRGALAGPVAVGAVVLPGEQVDLMSRLGGIRDSKIMTPAEREHWAAEIKKVALAWGVGFASNTEIDHMGIVPATLLASQRALGALNVTPAHLLVDYLLLTGQAIPQTSLVRGDARSLSIASASILAKTERDAVLIEMDKIHPGYGFARNKGYATHAHRLAVRELGPCPVHRRSFEPVCEYDSLFPPKMSIPAKDADGSND